MVNLLFIFLLCSFPLISVASGSCWNGFLSLKDARLPVALSKQKIIQTTFQIETVGSNEVPSIIEITNQHPNFKEIPPDTLEFYEALQIKNCINQKIKKCPIFKKVFISTGFSIDDLSTLATALHVLHDWRIQTVLANPEQKYENLTAPLILKSSEGHTIYNSALSDISFQVKFMNRDKRLLSNTFPRSSDEPYFSLFTYSDYIEIQFSKPIFKDYLKRAKYVRFSESDQIYCFGYPKVSEFYSIFNVSGKKPYPEDFSLTVSTGYFWASDKSYFGVSCASMRGQSGGPALNINGEVVGVLRDRKSVV